MTKQELHDWLKNGNTLRWTAATITSFVADANTQANIVPHVALAYLQGVLDDAVAITNRPLAPEALASLESVRAFAYEMSANTRGPASLAQSQQANAKLREFQNKWTPDLAPKLDDK